LIDVAVCDEIITEGRAEVGKDLAETVGDEDSIGGGDAGCAGCGVGGFGRFAIEGLSGA
jgi:hypothetical protein